MITGTCKYCGVEYNPLPDRPPVYASELLSGCCGEEDCVVAMWVHFGIRGSGSPSAKLRAPSNDAYERRQPTQRTAEQRKQDVADRRAEVARLFAIGYDSAGIAKALDVHKVTINSDIRSLGLSTGKVGRKVDHARRQQIKQQILQGKTSAEIIAALGVSPTTIAAMRKELC